MFNPWYEATMLAIELNSVIYLRLMKLAQGGTEAQHEVEQMVSEKVNAVVEAMGTMMCGGTPATVLGRYREHVAANAERLAPSPRAIAGLV